jgi:hypothetical protein
VNQLNERYPDVLGDQEDPQLLRCVADFEATCSVFALPPERDAACARALAEHSPPRHRHLSALRRSWPHLPLPRTRRRLASATLAALLLAGGAGGYLHSQNPTPVSAQTVLQRAAAAHPGPNQAVHFVYTLTASGGYTGTADVWVGVDASGAPSQFALTENMTTDGVPAPELSSRMVASGPTVQTYDSATNTVTISTGRPIAGSLGGVWIGTLMAQKLGMAREANQQTGAFDLRQTTLDGFPVYAVDIAFLQTEVSSSPGTFYFDTASYVLRGADWSKDGRTWQARLDSSKTATMSLSAVPANTFTLNPPSSARVVRESASDLSKGRVTDGFDLGAALAAACKSTPSTVSTAMQAGQKSLLAICQETSPDMTADSLVSALLVPFKKELDAKVAAGAMTSAQEADALSGLRIKLTYTITGQPGTSSGNK